ncbi:MAG: D-alanyl-D-alanine carboxypeptidase family protein [Bacillota bacterium]
MTPIKDDDLPLYATAAILMDATTGEILYEKNPHQKMYPASTTKIMTALLAVENCDFDESYIFSNNAIFSISPGSSHIAMQPEEELTIEQSLYAIFLQSANEVSNGIAEHVGGSLTEFAEMMTARAKELGAYNTNFVNAHGLYDDEHYTTAYDLALIGQKLIEYEEVLPILNSMYYEIPPTKHQEEIRYLHGQHRMMKESSDDYYESVFGGKTGFVNESLNTLITFAKEGDTTLIAVALRCGVGEHYLDTKKMFDYGFENYHTLCFEDYMYSDTTVDIVADLEDPESEILTTITTAVTDTPYLTVPTSMTFDDFNVVISVEERITTPVSIGDLMGTIEVRGKDNIVYDTIEILATSAYSMAEIEAALEALPSPINWKLIGGIALGIVFAVLFVIFFRRSNQLRKKQKEVRKRIKERREQDYINAQNEEYEEVIKAEEFASEVAEAVEAMAEEMTEPEETAVVKEAPPDFTNIEKTFAVGEIETSINVPDLDALFNIEGADSAKAPEEE